MDGLNNKETGNAVRIDVEKPDGADIVRDEVWLICAVAKWVVLAIVTGLAVGLVSPSAWSRAAFCSRLAGAWTRPPLSYGYIIFCFSPGLS